MSALPIYRTLSDASDALDSTVVTIGNFDGAHIGHQAIFEEAKHLAVERGVTPIGLTFEPHPVRHFRPDAEPFRLTTSEQRAKLMLEYGLEAVIELEFDEDMATLEPAEFVRTILVDGLDADSVVVGQDFAFGRNRAGTTEVLSDLCDEYGIHTKICSHVEESGESISSTRIRRLLDMPQLQEATKLLGRPYRIAGTIVEGDRRGRVLGYPTANLATENRVLPPNGVYATTLHADGFPALQSITNIGTRPTFDGDDVTVETFVLDGDDEELNLYEKRAGLDIWKFVREEKEFDGPDGLIRQIQKDVKTVESYFGLT